MKTNKRISKLSRHMIAMVLTVSLVAGIAGFDAGSYAVSSSSSPFKNTKSSYQHNSRFDGNVIANGVDVSYFQSTASDWTKAKKNGCDYAIIRVTYTTYGSGSLNIDSKFSTHYKKAKAAGVMTGVYVFSQAKTTTEAAKEAQYAVNRLKALGIGPEDLELPVYMDYEFAGPSSGKKKGRLYGISSSTAVKCANAFCDVIRANGYDPGIYACTNFFSKYLGSGKNLASDIDLWCAQYYNRNESSCKYSKWQYTSTAKVNGILFYSNNKQGSTDADFWYISKKNNAKPITEIYGNTTLKYTGKPVKPTLEIYSGNTLLKEGTDYIVGGINNINKSTSGAYAYVKGVGKYSGYALVPLKIGSSYISHLGLSGVGGAIFGNSNGSSYTIGKNKYSSYVRGVPSGTTAGTLLKNLKLKSGYTNYKLAVIDSTGAKVDSSKKLYTGMMVGVYSGSTLKGTADITVRGDTINNRGANYLVKANRSKVTTSSANVSSSSSSSSSSTQKTITVKKTKIKSLKAGKGRFTIKVMLRGRKEVNGYEVKISRYKSMYKGIIKTIGTEYHLRTKTITHLKRNTTFYVQARAYKIVNGKYYYSDWTSVKKVKTK